jgi:hypothetical protein
MWLGALATIDVARGQTEGAAERIDAVLNDYERDGPNLLASGGAIAYLSRTVIALAESERIARVRTLIMPLSGQGAYIAGFAGPIDYHLGLLEAALGNQAAALARFDAALEFSQRLGAPRWAMRCRAALDRELSVRAWDAA